MLRVDDPLKTGYRFLGNSIKGKEDIQGLVEEIAIPGHIGIYPVDAHNNEAMGCQMRREVEAALGRAEN
jgi:hypothetical protein